MKYKARKFLSLLLVMCMVFQFMPTLIANAASDVVTLAFGDSAITETVSGDGYSISGTTLTISAAGTYKITGSCASGNIEVAKNLSDVTLILDDLNLTSTTGAPVVVKKSSNVTIHIENTVTLTDNENPEDEDSTDTDVPDAYEGAAIKVKAGSTVEFCGSGTLNANGNAKNGIKGSETATLTFSDSRTTYNITAANNGIGSDGSVVIYGGTFDIEADNDGIKSVPEEADTESVGAVEIYGGTFDLEVAGDGIQADSLLKIEGGDFNIKTFEGYDVSGTKYYNVSHNLNKDTAGTFDADTMSCKALKASGDRTDITNELLITGGTFNINSSDDAIHSDEYATVTGGTFYIYTGDDGMHADTSLTLGEENGYDRNPDVYVYTCFEGLEGGTVYIYEGRYWINALDDGINAAGGSDDDSTGDSFVPGGQPGRPGFGNMGSGSTDTSSYALYVYGGDIYIDCLGDGLDSNGNLSLYGGNLDVFSQAQGGENSPYDCDGTWLISGATVFGAGSNGMNQRPSTSDQKYTTSNTTVNANTVVNVSDGTTTLHSVTLPRRVGYMIYSSPDVTSSVNFTTGGTLSSCQSTSWEHDWNDGEEDSTTGIVTYSCQDCDETETKSVDTVTTYQCDDTHAYEENENENVDEGFVATFSVDEGVAGIDIYYTQDYTTPDETDVTSAVSRDSDTGAADSSGSGQVNFRVILKDGYSLSSVTADANYKNVKDVSDENYTNTYRVTKITGDVTITIETSKSEEVEPQKLVITRIYGSGRCETAVEAAKELKTTLGVDQYNSIIIASGSNFADALAGSYLATVKDAAILLYKGENSVALNNAYIEENLSADGTVYLLGGSAAVPESVEESLKALGVNVKRLSGPTRYETNLAVLEEAGVNPGEEILVATGRNFADSLSASAVGKPILLVNGAGNSLSDGQKEFLAQYGGGKLTILGGAAAVSDALETELNAYGTVNRISGSNRYETSVKIAEEYFGEVDTVVIASGKKFPDGLTGGPVAYAKGAPLLLTNTGSEIADYVAGNPVMRAYIMGGTAAVPDSAVETIFQPIQ